MSIWFVQGWMLDWEVVRYFERKVAMWWHSLRNLGMTWCWRTTEQVCTEVWIVWEVWKSFGCCKKLPPRRGTIMLLKPSMARVSINRDPGRGSLGYHVKILIIFIIPVFMSKLWFSFKYYTQLEQHHYSLLQCTRKLLTKWYC